MAPARVPDFATLSEAAYEAADRLIERLDACISVDFGDSDALREDYRIKKDKALKAIRGRKDGEEDQEGEPSAQGLGAQGASEGVALA